MCIRDSSKSIILQQKMKTIGICSDHAGFELKQYVKGWLETKGWAYKDFGTYTTESCDYAEDVYKRQASNSVTHPGLKEPAYQSMVKYRKRMPNREST